VALKSLLRETAKKRNVIVSKSTIGAKGRRWMIILER